MTTNGQDLSDYLLSRDRVRREVRPHAKYAQADLVAYALNVGDSIELEEPVSLTNACSSKDKTSRFRAMQEEMDSLSKNNNWTLVKRLTDQKVIGYKRIYKRKPRIPSVELAHLKARVVAKGIPRLRGLITMRFSLLWSNTPQ